MVPACFIIVRGVHITSCLLIFGWCLFARWFVNLLPTQSTIGRAYQARLHWIMIVVWPISLISAVFWFIFVVQGMSGLPLDQALQRETIQIVWRQTRFGGVWQFHCLLGVIAWGLTTIGCGPLKVAGPRRAGLALCFSGLFLASLAWAGHGLVGSSAAATWHLGADILHLLVAGIWPTGLLPLAWLLHRARTDSTDFPSIVRLIDRFSLVSLSSVGLLLVTGLVNSWILVGSIPGLFQTVYGRVLCVKIVLFGLAIALGAQNLLWLRPRLRKPPGTDQSTAYMHLRRNLHRELVLTTAIILIVAILGTLAPVPGN